MEFDLDPLELPIYASYGNFDRHPPSRLDRGGNFNYSDLIGIKVSFDSYFSLLFISCRGDVIVDAWLRYNCLPSRFFFFFSLSHCRILGF